METCLAKRFFNTMSVSQDSTTNKIQKKRAYQTRTRELWLKISVNSTISILAAVALFKLIPYQLKQQEGLADLNRKTQAQETRVSQLRKNFSRNFDPVQSRKIMQELTPEVDPNQRQIFFLKDKK